MFVAHDESGNRIYPDTYDGGICFCPYCNREVYFRNGKERRPHFAHKKGSECPYDSDNKSEWHMRMQEYFPKESREVRFEDDKTGEIHIADIYLKDSKTVIEFQKSRIDDKEFLKRTSFHWNAGRRIVWIFNESMDSKKQNHTGRFKYDPEICYDIPPYDKLCFVWKYQRRKFLIDAPDLRKYMSKFSVCVYTGVEGDTVRRIVNGHCDFKIVTLSGHPIIMLCNLDSDIFFKEDEYWKMLKVREYYDKNRIYSNTKNTFLNATFSKRTRRL